MRPERIAYYCPRINLLKLYGPVLAEQARRRNGLADLIIVPEAPLITYAAKNRRLATALRLAQLREETGPGPEISCVDSPARFLEVLLSERVRAVVSVGLRLPPAIRDGVLVPSRKRGVRWCSLGYLHEELFHVLADGVGILDHWDVPTTFSQSGVERLEERLAERRATGAERANKLKPIGFVECDQVADFDRRALREKYGLPQDRPVICFATAPPFETFRTARPMRWCFRQAWYRGDALARLAGRWWNRRWRDLDYLAGYREIVRCLRRFADRHQAVLVAKTREKHADPAYMRHAMDRLFSDGSYYPFRTLELLHLADLYIGIYSSTAFEAAFLGRRIRTIAPFPPEVLEDPLFLEFKRDFFFGSCGHPGIWNAPGFSELNHTYIAREWEAFREWAETGPLDLQVDAVVKSAVVGRVIGFEDFKASARFLDLVEMTLGREGGER
jgi:hypothetical protein